MDAIDRLLEEYPNTMEHFRFATTDAVQSQISAGLKYKTEANNRERIRFTYYSGVLVLKGAWNIHNCGRGEPSPSAPV